MSLLGFLSQVVAGLNSAAGLFVIAAGLALVWGVLHIVNFAHGSFYLIGAYSCYTFVKLFGGGNISFILAVILAPIIVALVSAIVEIFLFRRIYSEVMLYQFALAFGLVYIFSDLMKLTWGVVPHSLKRPDILNGSISFSGIIFPTYSLFTMGVASLVALTLWLILHKTRFGKLVRAVHQDTEMAGSLGVNVLKIRTAIFMIGSYLAGLGGAVAAGSQGFFLGLEPEIAILAFIVIIIGGPGGVGGPVVGALLIGMVEGIGIIFVPKLAIAFVYILLIIVLYTRPWGLLGKEPVLGEKAYALILKDRG